LDQVADTFKLIYQTALKNPELLHQAPTTTLVGRVDEVGAARNPKLRYVVVQKP